jgi:hypothetical protein
VVGEIGGPTGREELLDLGCVMPLLLLVLLELGGQFDSGAAIDSA